MRKQGLHGDLPASDSGQAGVSDRGKAVAAVRLGEQREAKQEHLRLRISRVQPRVQAEGSQLRLGAQTADR